MILVALGANLPSRFGSPFETIEAAKGEMEERGINVLKASQTIQTPAWPDPLDPPYSNAVVSVGFSSDPLGPVELLNMLHEIEQDFGRERRHRNASRVIDLDLIAYEDVIINENDVFIPHPRLHERGFVLFPLKDIAPNWGHPVLKKSVLELIEMLPEDQKLQVA